MKFNKLVKLVNFKFNMRMYNKVLDVISMLDLDLKPAVVTMCRL